MKRQSVRVVLAAACAVLVFSVWAFSTVPAAEFPGKGRIITAIIPYPAGGATDITTRMIVEGMKKAMGANFQTVNKAGAISQVGMTELVRSKPDGYTIGASVLPVLIITYLDAERKAIYTRKNFQPLGNITFPAVTVAVKADSPYKTIQDLVAAAKAKPEGLKFASSGLLSNNHLAILQFQKATGTRFTIVHFDGGAASMNALLGGHVDGWMGVVAEVLPHFKSGLIRVIGLMDRQETKFLPGVRTLESQGYKVYSYGPVGLSAPAGTPKAAVDTLAAALKKACEDEGFLKKMDEMGFPIKYLGPEEYAKFWADMEQQVEPLVKEAKQQ